MILYKYLSPERLDVLENACIRFTQPDELNDPFESRPCMSGIREHYGSLYAKQYPDLDQEAIGVLLDNFIDKFPSLLGNSTVILSLSGTCEDQLMWSHYCESHKGFVIGFDADNDFFSAERIRVRPTRITYSRERANASVDGETPPTEFLASDQEFFLTKSEDWDYEDEYRVLADAKAADRTIDGPSTISLFSFPRNAVKRVILGCRTSDDVESQIINLLSSKYNDVELFNARLNDREFKMDVVPYQTRRSFPSVDFHEITSNPTNAPK